MEVLLHGLCQMLVSQMMMTKMKKMKKKRKRNLDYHYAKRADLYKQAYSKKQWNICLDIIKDEAKLSGSYPDGKHKIEETREVIINIIGEEKKRKVKMTRELIDLTGKRFGRLTVIKRSYPNGKNYRVKWLCKCDCGNEKIIASNHLIKNEIKSCGCLGSEARTTHGMSKSGNKDNNFLFKMEKNEATMFKSK